MYRPPFRQGVTPQILVYNLAQKSKGPNQIRLPRTVATNEYIQTAQFKSLLPNGLEVYNLQLFKRAHFAVGIMSHSPWSGHFSLSHQYNHFTIFPSPSSVTPWRR
jgi:hypothetical protein